MDESTVELIDYLRVPWRQKWVIIVTFVAAIVAARSVGQAVSPTYQVETSLLLLPPPIIGTRGGARWQPVGAGSL